MPKNPQASDYRMSVDHVIETGQVTADQKIAILVTAGSTRLRLELEPAAEQRLCADRSARLLGIKARLPYRRPSQLQHKGPHAAQAAPLPLPRQPPRPQDRRPAPGSERDRAPSLGLSAGARGSLL